jgi:hypothetical protein
LEKADFRNASTALLRDVEKRFLNPTLFKLTYMHLAHVTNSSYALYQHFAKLAVIHDLDFGALVKLWSTVFTLCT